MSRHGVLGQFPPHVVRDRLVSPQVGVLREIRRGRVGEHIKATRFLSLFGKLYLGQNQSHEPTGSWLHCLFNCPRSAPASLPLPRSAAPYRTRGRRHIRATGLVLRPLSAPSSVCLTAGYGSKRRDPTGCLLITDSLHSLFVIFSLIIPFPGPDGAEDVGRTTTLGLHFGLDAFMGALAS